MKRAILTIFALASLVVANAQSPKDLPAAVAKSYSKQIDAAVSDEFNGKKLDWSKWGRRNTGGYMVERYVDDKSLVVMESESNGGERVEYVSVKATTKDGKPRTAGIVTKTTGYFGFYVVKFRINGLGEDVLKDNKTIWHPSVWSGINSNIAESTKKVKNSGNWLEIDLMEWETGHNGWSCDAPARFVPSGGGKSRKVVTSGKGQEKAVLTNTIKHTDGAWATVGFEYSPDYLRIWEWRDGKWVDLNVRDVRFVDEDMARPELSYTPSTIGRAAAQPCFWLLGNVVSRYLYKGIEDGTCKYYMGDHSVDFDYFRYYPHKSVESAEWSCR